MGNMLPICSPWICQMMGGYTPRPQKRIRHSVPSYIWIMHRDPRPKSPQTHAGSWDGHVKQWRLLWDRWRQVFMLSEPFLIFRSTPPQPLVVLLFCCPINHTPLINRPTVPSLPTAAAPTPGPALLPSRHAANASPYAYTYTQRWNRAQLATLTTTKLPLRQQNWKNELIQYLEIVIKVNKLGNCVISCCCSLPSPFPLFDSPPLSSSFATFSLSSPFYPRRPGDAVTPSATAAGSCPHTSSHPQTHTAWHESQRRIY